eukprot:TRINITY_DN5708_c8_g1_i1.p2 TRINITY_DN5708_c8_g1~~TRINITY_DN5708_c8_g1_i1.p2  ORF type:complete len:222 (+),score=-17.93 TRINITY_DN5708_c8_g1_i1:106-771(+)
MSILAITTFLHVLCLDFVQTNFAQIQQQCMCIYQLGYEQSYIFLHIYREITICILIICIYIYMHIKRCLHKSNCRSYTCNIQTLQGNITINNLHNKRIVILQDIKCFQSKYASVYNLRQIITCACLEIETGGNRRAGLYNFILESAQSVWGLCIFMHACMHAQIHTYFHICMRLYSKWFIYSMVWYDMEFFQPKQVRSGSYVQCLEILYVVRWEYCLHFFR